jgi:hypothetical protein
MPICSIGQDLGIMVLFAVEPISITPNSIEFLGYLSRAASENIIGFIPPSISTPVSAANVEQFVGIWDIFELIKKYSSDISFHILPIGPLQSFFDYQESMTFRDIFPEGSQELLTVKENEVSSEFKQVSDTNSYADFSTPTADLLHSHLGSFSMAYSNLDQASTDSLNSCDMKDSDDFPDSSTSKSFFAVDARESYRKHPYRFHELMIALLGMTIFDAAELWMVSARTGKLHVVAALHRDGVMEVWTSQGRNLALERGQDVPGRVTETSQPFWDNAYDKNVYNLASYPRAETASQIGVKTALGIPLPGAKGSCGSLTLYSRTDIEVEPLVATFVTKATQLISASALGATTLSLVDIESLVYNPTDVMPMQYQLTAGGQSIGSRQDVTNPHKPRSSSFSMKIQMMGSLGKQESCQSTSSLRRDNGGRAKRKAGKVISPDPHMSLSDSLLEAAEYVLNGDSNDNPLASIPLILDPVDRAERKFKRNKHQESQSDGSVGSNMKSLDSNDLVGNSIPTLMSAGSSSSRRCQFEGCTKCAQGATKFCIGHGGNSIIS